MAEPRIIRVVVFEVRPRRIAYAVFETPARLLDWGMKGFRSRPITGGGFMGVLRDYRPSVIVLRDITSGSRRDNPRAREFVRVMAAEARRSALAVAFVTGRELEQVFRQYGLVTKHQIAETIGEWFPELSTHVPMPRKAWQSEHWNMPVFDAIAMAVAYLAEERDLPGGQVKSNE